MHDQCSPQTLQRRIGAASGVLEGGQDTAFVIRGKQSSESVCILPYFHLDLRVHVLCLEVKYYWLFHQTLEGVPPLPTAVVTRGLCTCTLTIRPGRCPQHCSGGASWSPWELVPVTWTLLPLRPTWTHSFCHLLWLSLTWCSIVPAGSFSDTLAAPPCFLGAEMALPPRPWTLPTGRPLSGIRAWDPALGVPHPWPSAPLFLPLGFRRVFISSRFLRSPQALWLVTCAEASSLLN